MLQRNGRRKQRASAVRVKVIVDLAGDRLGDAFDPAQAQASGLPVRVLHYTLLARSVGVVIPIESMFLVVPIAVFVMMVPISINAIGVREAIFVFIFSQYGVAEEQSLLVGLIAYGFSLLQGILGGVVFALRRYT